MLTTRRSFFFCKHDVEKCFVCDVAQGYFMKMLNCIVFRWKLERESSSIRIRAYLAGYNHEMNIYGTTIHDSVEHEWKLQFKNFNEPKKSQGIERQRC